MVEKEPGILGWIASLAPWAVGQWQKVVLQFKMYGQHMFYTLGRSFAQSIKEIRRKSVGRRRRRFWVIC
ncbi:hypothetical protein JKM78_005091 [Citrobacter freundii]|uniref:hypothetical protein n=1 Tax=Citrobacter sp. Cf108 TaxID=2985063 RepID=UPI002576C9BB|nr:hypothetical protein [Citrobacter sp. Cf108]EKX5205223.1 hypothetical protein [Citrobacter freundii]MDM3180807.1 hypothetical protein [Citrobacter sp. Cf108]HBN5385563.1 hypothetical protein [Citrobacter freundii]HBN5501827.1 hypothetical protein [Citrobacter freundii]HBU9126329.1 hypothetical protein [Citrobacter freundii]